MFSNFFQGVIDKRVDERIAEILKGSGDFEFKKVSDSEAKEEISSFIKRKHDENVTQLSTLDFVLNLRLPAEQVERILERFEKEKKVKEIEEIYAR